MGSNNLTTKNPGDPIIAEDPNQYKEALNVNMVPRNSSGIPTDQGGDLGETLKRWRDAFIRELFLGTISNGLSIAESSGEIIIKIGGVTKGTFGANGYEGLYKNLSLPFAALAADAQLLLRSTTITSTVNWPVPANVYGVMAYACGGGGGGGGGGGANTAVANAGGGGGGAAPIGFHYFTVTPGGTLNIVIGSGGTGGAGETDVGTGSTGQRGGTTTITDNVGTVNFRGGYPGAGGQTGAGAGGAGGAYFGPGGIGGGNGGVAGSPGDAAPDSIQAAGVAGGTSSGGGGGGGGGGNQFGNGGGGANGTGGDAASPGGGSTTRGGGGGGGAGGGSSGSRNGSDGGAGGAGQAILIWVAGT